MSKQYPGGFITKNYVPPTPTAAPGIWTLDQQLQAQKTGTWPFGGPFNYIESCFSTYLYTGNSSTQTITNDIDLAGEGGLVWVKWRSGLVGSGNHVLVDTSRGVNKFISSNTTAAEATQDTVSAFNSNGFTLTGEGGGKTNYSGDNYASWTFRKQPKFFDIVTWTGDGTTPRNISHSLGSVPGCIIIKRTDDTGNWIVYHRSLNGGVDPQQYLLFLNSTLAQIPDTGSTTLANTVPTSTQFTVGTSSNVNASGGSYVAYLFAHDAGGFGESGTDNVISCGSFTADNSGGGAYTGAATVNLGYEPQFVIIKQANSTLSEPGWMILDTLRGYRAQAVSGEDIGQQRLQANSSGAETNSAGASFPTSTGFSALQLTGGATYIYIAIRRGPMKVPTDGTKVFSPVAYTGTGATRTITGVSFPLDMNITMDRAAHTYNTLSDRLRGLTCDGTATQPQLRTNATDAEVGIGNGINGTLGSAMDGYTIYGGYSQLNQSSDPYISYNFRRTPGFFDEVCYTGTGVTATKAHNLTVVPELFIVKRRDGVNDWYVYSNAEPQPFGLTLNSASSATAVSVWANTAPTSSVFTVSGNAAVNGSGATYVAYLFATCAGVSKVGSYTGTGATQTIACGFTAGARFVLIKRTDTTGDWYVWDSARGIVAGDDPYLLLNSAAAEVTNTDYVDTAATGFEISSTAPAAINASGGTFIFLAIA